MLRRYETIYSPAVGRDVQVLAYGHYGDPLIVFPSGGGAFHDFEDNGMIDALAWLIEAGKLKVYCPESLDNESWLSGNDPHWKAVRHNDYQAFVLNDLVPAIRFDCRNEDIKIALAGCSIGAYHAVNFALKYPETFPYALGMSGRYDVEKFAGSSSSEEVYFNNPMAYVANFHGGHLDYVRAHTHIALVCGQGAWEHKSVEDTHRLADLLADKQISHERDVWGHDVEHHWYWWRKQIAYHLSKALDH